MMKHIRIALLVLSVALLLLLASCTPPAPACPPHADENEDLVCDVCGEELEPDFSGIDLSGVRLEDAAFLYNGDSRSLAVKGKLPEGVSVTYDGNGVVDAGVYKVTASFRYTYRGKEYHLDSWDKTATITINKASYDLSHLSFPSLSVFGDGNAHTPEIMGDLPEGVEVQYEGGAKSEAGTYTVTANFKVNEKNYNIPDSMTTTLVIVDAPATLGGISVSSMTVYCDGEIKRPEYLGALGAGASFVGYRGTNAEPILPGSYQLFLDFTDGANTISLPTRVDIIVDPDSATEGLIFEPVSGGVAVVGYEGTSKVVIVPNSTSGRLVLSIASGAFMNSDIIYAYLPDGIKNIGNNAFRDAASLVDIRISDKTKVIGAAAFRNTALTKLHLPKYLEAIGHGAVEGTKLEEIDLPFIGGSHNTSNPYLGYIFGADGYGGNSLFVPDSLKKVVLLDSCLEIAPRAFYDCENLTEVVIGEGVTKIGAQAFAYSGITEIFIPLGVTDIPVKAEDLSVSPFFGTSKELVIKLEAEALPSGYGSAWSVVAIENDKPVYATVEYGKTEN